MGSQIRTRLATIAVGITTAAALTTIATPAAAATPAIARTATAAAATAAIADPYCQATIVVEAQWSSGAVLEVLVRNISSVPVRWRVTIRFFGPVTVQVWNAQYTQSGSVGTLVPLPPNDILQPGQSVIAGQFILTGTPIVLPQVDVSCTPVTVV